MAEVRIFEDLFLEREGDLENVNLNSKIVLKNSRVYLGDYYEIL